MTQNDGNRTDPRTELIDVIQGERAFWRAIVREVGESRMTEPGPMGDWSFKGSSLADEKANLFSHLHDEHVPSVRAWLAARD